jgi:transposase
MLVLASGGLSNRQIALKLGVNQHVVGWVREEYEREGLVVLGDRPRAGRTRSRNEQSIQKVVQTVCQAPPKGLSHFAFLLHPNVPKHARPGRLDERKVPSNAKKRYGQ